MAFPTNPFIVTSVLIVTLMFALYFIESPNALVQLTSKRPYYNSTTVEPRDELDLVLREVSFPNKTLIMAFINQAYVEQSVYSETTMLKLFLDSFWLGEDTRPLVDHLLMVAVDETAYQSCIFNRLRCYKLVTEGVDFTEEKLYMSKDFIKMTWTRTLFQLEVLQRGYNFIFTDTDILWLRNPFPRLSRDNSADIQYSVDRLSDSNVNTGFYFIKSNDKTIQLYKIWYGGKELSTGLKDQDVLQDLMRQGIFGKLGIKLRLLETGLFSGFCQDSKVVRKVVTVHANCCRHIKAKSEDLTAALRDWKRYKASKIAATNFTWSPHIACKNSWKS